MASNIIISDAQNDPLARYEELLLRKNELKKECFQLEQHYIRTFGDAVMALFRLHIECAKKVKTIEFCQRYKNRGLEPDLRELQSFVQHETRGLHEHLERMAAEYEAANDMSAITESESIEIKRIYRRIVKRLHPDTHPEVNDSEKLQDLWDQVTAAYRFNQLKELKELEVLAASALAEAGVGIAAPEIPDLEEKIAGVEEEIKEIMDRDPYRYKFLLSVPEAVRLKKESLQAEQQDYRDHSAALDEKLAAVLPEGSFIVWED